MQKEIKNHSELIDELSLKYDLLSGSSQHWIGLAGGPGSGKSTVAGKIKEALRDQVDIIPMDGYHYSCSELNEMENPEQAHERRGAPFTFNSRKLVDDLIEARRTGSGHFPDFDHKERDPVEGRIFLKPGKRIVIVEGNYLLLNDHPWNRLQSEVFDEGWFLYVTLEECKRRVLKRHHQVMKMSREESMWRLMTNDGPNAELVIQESIGNADRLVEIRNHPSGDEVA
ncbi:MAG: AAA family ATPase [Verrucomicrobiales bacterium]|jgi:pantothenate kinase|nr:AAA family ATPase [Verrucomicrobiales bacterium]